MSSSKLFYASGGVYAEIDPGLRRYFYEDGTLKTVEPYLEERLHGEVTLYWPNGKKKRQSHFDRGIREGLDAMWNEGGYLVDEGKYENGKPVGVHRRWSGMGNLIEEIEYIDSIRFNIRQWDETGQLRFIGMWADESYLEKTWDRFEKTWIEKKGRWDGRRLIYI